MYSQKYDLHYGVWIGSNLKTFDLWQDDKLILNDCENFSYVHRVLIVVKKDNTLIVFSRKNSKVHLLEKVAEFKSYSNDACLKIRIDDHFYVIDQNCQITYSYVKKTD